MRGFGVRRGPWNPTRSESGSDTPGRSRTIPRRSNSRWRLASQAINSADTRRAVRLRARRCLSASRRSAGVRCVGCLLAKRGRRSRSRRDHCPSIPQGDRSYCCAGIQGRKADRRDAPCGRGRGDANASDGAAVRASRGTRIRRPRNRSR